MTKNFTTPAFAKVLKEHGNDIDTPYCYIDGYEGVWAYKITGNRLLAFDIEGEMGYRDTQLTPKVKEQISPAYPLTEALRWLPKETVINGYQCRLNQDLQVVNYFTTDTDVVAWYLHKSLPIEDLITQGLTDGWLTKESILQAIKDNAK
jgi:hypothetical protein